MPNKKTPLFITFEGGEGAGKTTLIHKLDTALQSQGYSVVRTREPGGSRLGEFIRGWLLNQDSHVAIGFKAELLLFLAARAQHLEDLIQPALQQGKIVLCDRFNDSTIVYQGIARGLGQGFVENLCNLVCGTTQPNLTLFLDLDPKVGLIRTQRLEKEHAKAGEMDRIESEKEEFHHLVRRGFQSLAQQYPHRIHTLDAMQPEPQVYAEALKIINAMLI